MFEQEQETVAGRKVVQNLILFAKEHPTGAPRWEAKQEGVSRRLRAQGCG